MEKLVELLSVNARKRFDINTDMGYTVFDCNKEYVIDPSDFLSMGRSTPFEGRRVFGECLLTVYNDKTVYVRE